MKKIVLAFDSFKGCLSATEVCRAAAEGVRRVFPECQTVTIPMADGGEGMLEIFVRSTGGRYVETKIHGPLMEEREVRYGVSADGLTACIETAACCGLPLVAPERRNPMYTTSYGVGETIRDALQRGYRKFIIGLGGSATNDGGTGMLQALGYRFFHGQKEMEEVLCGRHIGSIGRIDKSRAVPQMHDAEFTVACDVRNPFFGPAGAARIFAPQKGADAGEVEELERGMEHLSKIYREATGKDVSQSSGAGAAGGMGGCFQAFFPTTLRPGTELLLDITGLEAQLEKTDFILTGEGKSDRQTLMGKVPYGILKAGQRRDIPVVLLSGCIEESEALTEAGFEAVFSIQPAPLTTEEAMRPDVARENLRRSTEQLCRIIRAARSV